MRRLAFAAFEAGDVRVAMRWHSWSSIPEFPTLNVFLLRRTTFRMGHPQCGYRLVHPLNEEYLLVVVDLVEFDFDDFAAAAQYRASG